MKDVHCRLIVEQDPRVRNAALGQTHPIHFSDCHELETHSIIVVQTHCRHKETCSCLVVALLGVHMGGPALIVVVPVVATAVLAVVPVALIRIVAHLSTIEAPNV